MEKICLSQRRIDEIKNVCRKYGNDPGELINILHGVQDTLGYLPKEVQELIALELGISAARVYGVVSFYSFFTMKPKGKYPISVCMGTACYVRGGEKVLDLGCGSGILSIAALRLGAVSAKAVDIDDKCLTVAYENAALNGIGKDRYAVLVGDVLSNGALREALGGGYDVVVANIVADVIIGLAPMVRQFLKPGGLFLCSGIIDDRAVEVADALRLAGWAIMEARESEGWFSYLCK